MGMDVGHSSGKRGKARPEMNVTPLVDVVLVLLIIFMVITPLIHAHLFVHVPDAPDEQAEATPPSPDDEQPLVVSVTEQGDIRINRDVVEDAEFVPRLRRVLAARGDRKLFFDADDRASLGRAVAVLDMAREGGGANIAVLTEAIE